MIKINLLTDEIKPYLHDKKSFGGSNKRKTLLIVASVVLLLSGIGVLSKVLFFNEKNADIENVQTNDTELNLPNPEDYTNNSDKKDTLVADKVELSNVEKMTKRKNSEDKWIKNSLNSDDNSKRGNTTSNGVDKVTQTSKKDNVTKEKKVSKATVTSKSVTKNKKINSVAADVIVSSKRILNFINNEHKTPYKLFSSINSIDGINKIRLNNPQTVYLEIDENSYENVKSHFSSNAVSVRKLKVKDVINLELTYKKADGIPNLKNVTEIPDIEANISTMIKQYSGYPVLKDNSKPLGKYFSYTVKYVIPSISYNEFLQLLESIGAEYEGLGISKVVYDAKTKRMKLDISIYAK